MPMGIQNVSGIHIARMSRENVLTSIHYIPAVKYITLMGIENLPVGIQNLNAGICITTTRIENVPASIQLYVQVKTHISS